VSGGSCGGSFQQLLREFQSVSVVRECAKLAGYFAGTHVGWDSGLVQCSLVVKAHDCMVPAMAALQGSFGGLASFVTVYVAEAHARECRS
jgi:hypothetical protein